MQESERIVSVVSIENDGVKSKATVKLNKPGTAEITAYDWTGNVRAVCEVTVKAVAAPKNFTVASDGYNKIKITWSKVSEADGYYVYRCNKSGSTIRKWRWNNSVTSFSDGGLTTGTTYYYKIKAYKVVDDVTYDGTYTSLKAAKPALSRPGTPGVSRYSSSYVKVKWKGVSGESGYQVYRAKSKNGSYSRVASVKMTTSSYPYAKIRTAKGKTYYYKVRAYKKIGNRYVYSSFSAPKSYKLR